MIGKTNAILGGAIEKPKITVTRIDQTITDPFNMITRVVDDGGIEAIRANSHRYTGTFANGVMTLKQLDDTNSKKYADGIKATLNVYGTDVWMKLPQFYWKCVQYATDVWDFYVAYGDKPDNTYNTWAGNDLIGVFKAASSSSKLYSVGYTNFTVNTSQTDFKAYARNRGDGFTIVKWKHHCMMAMLFYSMYKQTNSQYILGMGQNNGSNSQLGSTARLGMTDTGFTASALMTINFWGLESWWGDGYEFIDNVDVVDDVWKVTEDDGSVREAGIGIPVNGYISKMLFGENIDLIPTETSSSSANGYCDMYYKATSASRVTRRGCGGPDGGISFIYANAAASNASNNIGTRLAFRGNIVIE